MFSGQYGDAVGGGVDTDRAAAALEASLLVDGAASATGFGVGREDVLEGSDGWGALSIPGRSSATARGGDLEGGGGTPDRIKAPAGRAQK